MNKDGSTRSDTRADMARGGRAKNQRIGGKRPQKGIIGGRRTGNKRTEKGTNRGKETGKEDQGRH